MDNPIVLLCLIVPVAVIVLILIVNGNAAAAREKALAEARGNYQSALGLLKRDPTNATLRQRALDAGRTYSGLTRENKGVTVFDEVALKNDLDAATAGAVSVASPAAVAPPAPAPPPAAPPAASVADRLRQLDDLKAQGLITDEEHQARRVKILEGV